MQTPLSNLLKIAKSMGYEHPEVSEQQDQRLILINRFNCPFICCSSWRFIYL